MGSQNVRTETGTRLACSGRAERGFNGDLVKIVRTYIAGVVSSNPVRVAINAPLVRKATGNYLINSTSLKNSKPFLYFLLSSKSSMQRRRF